MIDDHWAESRSSKLDLTHSDILNKMVLNSIQLSTYLHEDRVLQDETTTTKKRDKQRKGTQRRVQNQRIS